MVSGGQPLAAQSELPPSPPAGARDAVVASEQERVDRMYSRLDAQRELAQRQLTETRAMGASGTPAARSERDAFATEYERRLIQLRGVENGLCFGRLDLSDGQRYYVGRIGLSDPQGARLLVDWRAPAAQAFYRATAAEPLGVRRRRHLQLSGRRVVGVGDDVLDANELVELAETDRSTLSAEASLMAALATSRTGRMTDIVATIQAEQDRIIRADAQGVLVVQGGPGTGKTAVALHRAAYLLYVQRERLRGSGVLVVGPNVTFLRYIEQVLPSLGETGVLLATPEELLPGVSVTAQEPLPSAVLKGDARMAAVLARAVYNIKRVPTTVAVLPFDRYELRLTRAQALSARRSAIATRQPHNLARPRFARAVLRQLARQLEGTDNEESMYLQRELLGTDEFREALNAMWPVRTADQMLTELYTNPEALRAAAPELSDAERALLARQEGSGWTTSDIPLLDELAELLGDPAELARAAEERRRRASEREYAEGVLTIIGMSDEVSADALAERFNTVGADGTVAERAAADRTWAFGHLIVDEAQEHSAMMWRLLVRRCPSRSMTVVGDVAQTGSVAGSDTWAQALDPFAEGRWQLAELSVNYRTPREIMDVAGDVLASFAPEQQPPSSVRDVGENPRAVRLDPYADQAGFAQLIRDAQPDEGTTAILVPEGARAAFAAGGDPLLTELALAGPDTANQLMLLEVRAAKGLEFDVVIVVDPQAILDGSPRGANDLYVALTRATTRVVVVHPGPLPEMLSRLESVQR
ncbi:MAG TPA: ATP-binding domain-containing protein [Frankiaceae bacterium]|jgi:DNA helicase IV|nr:ATP-binding domain-containing protein [Frankiaceae bacterium]